MKRCRFPVMLAWAIGCLPVAAFACKEIIVGNEGSGDLAVIDPKSEQVVARIPVGKAPRDMVLSLGRDQLYVVLGGVVRPTGADEQGALQPAAEEGAARIGVVDLTTRQMVRTIEGVSGVEHIALSADGNRLFAASRDQGAVFMFDARSGKLLARTPVGRDAEGVDVSPAGISVFATSRRDRRVSILDARSAMLVSRMSVGLQPRSTAFSPDGLRAYVANEASSTITVLDTASLRQVKTLHLPDGMSPIRVAVPRAGWPLYVSTGRGGEVMAIGPRTGKVLARAGSGARPRSMVLSPDDTRLYVANGSSNDVSVFELPRLELRTRISTGEDPRGIVCRDNWWANEGLSTNNIAPASTGAIP